MSRSWLYTQPDIREEVLRLRDLGRRAPGTLVPAHHRSSDASLLRRLEAATARNRELAQDNQRLRHQLAQALGQTPASAQIAERHDILNGNQHHEMPVPASVSALQMPRNALLSAG